MSEILLKLCMNANLRSATLIVYCVKYIPGEIAIKNETKLRFRFLKHFVNKKAALLFKQGTRDSLSSI